MQQIDWPGIRANAVTLGIRGAARAAAVNLSPEEQNRFVKRVLKRAEREGWEVKRKAAMSSAGLAVVTRAGAVPLSMSSTIVSGQEAALNVNADLSRRGRAALLRYGAEKAEHAAQLPHDEGLARSAEVASVAKTLAIAGDWKAVQGQPGPAAIVNVAVLLDGCQLPARTVETA